MSKGEYLLMRNITEIEIHAVAKCYNIKSLCLTTTQGEGVISMSWLHAGYSNRTNSPVAATSMTEA